MQCCDILQTLKESEIKKGVVGRVVHKAVGEFPLESRVWTCNKMCITTTIIVTLCVLYAGFRTKIKSACTTLRFRSSDKTEEIAEPAPSREPAPSAPSINVENMSTSSARSKVD